MAYDRYERERRWREGRPDFTDEAMNRERDFAMNRERDFDRSREDRGFFGRMGDEFRSWFGDEDAERRSGFDRDEDWESVAIAASHGPTSRPAPASGGQPVVSTTGTIGRWQVTTAEGPRGSAKRRGIAIPIAGRALPARVTALATTIFIITRCAGDRRRTSTAIMTNTAASARRSSRMISVLGGNAECPSASS